MYVEKLLTLKYCVFTVWFCCVAQVDLVLIIHCELASHTLNLLPQLSESWGRSSLLTCLVFLSEAVANCLLSEDVSILTGI